MWKILQPPAYKPEMEADKVDATLTMIKVAAGEIEIDVLADWIRANSSAR